MRWFNGGITDYLPLLTIVFWARYCCLGICKTSLYLVLCYLLLLRMSRVVSFFIPILETLGAQFALPALLYLCEVAEDGSVLAGVELELPMDAVVMVPQRKFFWCASGRECLDVYDQAALQAIAFLQRMYGFGMSDYNYGCMISYRDSMYSAVVLATCAARRVGRLERELLRALSPVSLPSESPSSLDWHLMSSRLLASVRYI